MSELVRFKASYILIFQGFETKCREVYKSAVITCSEEPLEEAPKKAKGEELPQCFHLFPIMGELNEREIMSTKLMCQLT
jgi:hypothetical protein